MRWLKRLFVGVLGICLLVLPGFFFLLWRSLPDYGRTVVVAGIGAPVRIAWSRQAVPHIFGKSDRDVFFGLGYAHAQDRLWQMETMRRTAQGRLSELFGAKTLHTDMLLRRMDIYGAAMASVAAQDSYTQAALSAYASGVNARMMETQGWGQAAPEFLLFADQVARWTPQDSLALMKLLALQLASHIDREVLRARVSRVVGPERLHDILPDDPSRGYVDLPQYSELFPELPKDDGVTRADLTPFLDPSSASNAWAVGPTRAIGGASLMANDPHLNFSAPTVWYLARLELASGGVIGGTIPGIPVILSGRSAVLGWGLTTANMDDQDVYIEKLNPRNAGEVLTPEGFKPMRTRHEEIAVEGGATEEIDLQWTDNGPVFPGNFYNFAAVTPSGHIVSIARTLFDTNDTSMSAAMHLMQSKSVSEALDLMQAFVTPAQNLTVIDRDHIALQLIGRMPRRRPDHATRGRMPSDGWIEANRWQGSLPYSDNPRFVDPVSGALGNTNNKTVDRPFPLHVSYDWGDTQRIQRLMEDMAARAKHDISSFIAMQNDPVSHSARTLAPVILATFGRAEGRRAEAMALLTHWNGAMDATRPEPLIWAVWLWALQHRLIADDLGPLADAIPLPSPVFLDRVFHDTQGAAAWCDDTRSPAPETCGEIAEASLDAALDEIASRHGSNLVAWRWGDAHQAVHNHPVLGQVALLGGLLNIQQPASGGDDTLLRGLTRGNGADPFADIHGAGYRGIYDLATPESSVFITSTGQSGHFLSTHYRDLGRLWLEGRYIPMVLDLQKPGTETLVKMLLLPQ